MNAKRDEEVEGFTAEEKAAMKERAAEVRKSKRSGASGDPAQELLDKIAEMPDEDRIVAEKIHALVVTHAPTLTHRTWYGMPAYAKDGKVLLFFQPASKFKARYSTLGFNDIAALDDGNMWPNSFAVASLDAEDEKRIAELIVRAVG